MFAFPAASLGAGSKWKGLVQLVIILLQQSAVVLAQTTPPPTATATSGTAVPTFTSFYEYSTTVSTGWVDTYTFTNTRRVRPGVTPTAAGVSTATYVYSSSVAVVVYLPTGAVADSDLAPTTTTSSYFHYSTIYAAPVTYTAPASCPSAFSYTTVKDVSPAASITAAATSTATGYYYVTAYLPPDAVSVTAATSDYVYAEYIASCTNPADVSSHGSSSYGSGSDDFTVCSARAFGCYSLHTYLIVLAAVLPSLFVLGWLESWLWFRSLMRGRQALRFGTICWILISVWVACFTHTSPSRPRADWPALEAQWRNMSAVTRFRLWWKWGFRHKYPEELLGPDPRCRVPAVLAAQQQPPEVDSVAGQQPQQRQLHDERSDDEHIKAVV